MAKLATDDLAGCGILLALRLIERSSWRTTCCRCLPSSQRFISLLRIAMPQPVHAAQSGGLALSLVNPQLLYVGLVRRNQRSLPASLCASSSTMRCSGVVIGIERSNPPLVHEPMSMMW